MTGTDTYKRIDGTTPQGGTYAVIYFRDKRGNACPERRATSCEIVEYSKDGEVLSRTYGSVHPPKR